MESGKLDKCIISQDNSPWEDFGGYRSMENIRNHTICKFSNT